MAVTTRTVTVAGPTMAENVKWPLSHIQISRNIANMPHKRFKLSHKIAKKATQLCVNFHIKK